MKYTTFNFDMVIYLFPPSIELILGLLREDDKNQFKPIGQCTSFQSQIFYAMRYFDSLLHHVLYRTK